MPSGRETRPRVSDRVTVAVIARVRSRDRHVGWHGGVPPQEVLHRLFVGRERDLAALISAYEDTTTGVVFVSGEFGMGKSALLKRFAGLLSERDAPSVWIDARSAGSEHAFADAAERLRDLASTASRSVLFVDHFHALADDKQWFFDVYLPSLPERTLVVVANRRDLTRMRRTSGLVVPFCQRVRLRAERRRGPRVPEPA